MAARLLQMSRVPTGAKSILIQPMSDNGASVDLTTCATTRLGARELGNMDRP